MIDCQLTNSDQRKEGKHISCKHCQETGDSQIYWGIQLDQDLLETLISIYPDWFNGYNLNLPNMTDNNNGLYQLSTPSPPKSEVDENSLQKSMDKNKESLKVKLMLRRPISQLIDQGIMPPLKTPPAFHEQRQKLERAKTGDLLKSKIQRRPARQQLIQQHILEDTTVDPSLQERQRLLKKARLQDDLNDRLSHRPGPLELIKGNILKTDEPLAQAIKEGQLTFRNTSEGELRKHPGPMFFYEEDSGSDIALSPSQESPVDIQGASSVNSICSSVQLSSPASLTTVTSSISDIRSPLSSLSSPGGSIGSPPTFATTSNSFCNVPTSSIFTSTASSANQIRSNQSTCPIKQEPGGGKARKKSKSKSQPKTRTIKFHEYKGPPNAQKNMINNTNNVVINNNNNNNNNNSSDSESTYDLLLQQQQLFLQWQLEWQHKYPQILLPATQKNSPSIEGTTPTSNTGISMTMSNVANNGTSIISHSRQPTPPINTVMDSGPGSPIVKTISKLEDLKVSDLKAELKKRNLPVSGPKPQLIERLKPFSDQVVSANSATAASINLSSVIDFNVNSNSPPSSVTPSTLPVSTPNSVSVDEANMLNSSASPPPLSPLDASNRSPSVVPMETDIVGNLNSIAMDTNNSTSRKQSSVSEENLKQQHKRIQELQTELQRSQLQFQKQQNILQQQQSKQQQQSSTASSVGSNTTKMLQQHLQQKMQHLQRQKLQQQQQQLLQKQQQLQQQQKQLIQQQVSVSAEDVAKQLQQPQTVQIPIVSTNAANITITSSPMSLPTTLAGQLLIGQNVLTTAHIPFVTLTNNNQVNIVNNSELPTAKTVRANSLPNGLGHTRTESLPNCNQPGGQMQRTTTDPQFIITRPPPAYDEATRQVTNPQVDDKDFQSDKKKMSKIQAVEDVLEILIRNGELPASVVQEPTTPTTPNASKSSSEPPTFPSSPSSSEAATVTIKSEPTESINNCFTNLLSSDCNAQREPNNFDLELELELEGLESMDLSNLSSDVRQAPPLVIPSSSMPSFGQSDSPIMHSNSNPMSSLDLLPASSPEEPVSMDVDIEWLDSIISPPSTPSTASQSIVHLTPPATTATHHENINRIYSGNNNENDHDPMLSVTTALHDPLDLFSLHDTDFKGPADLGTQLSWDRIDFAA